MRFWVKVDENWNVTITCPKQNPAWQQTHVMRKLAPDNLKRVFPAPLAGEMPNAGDPLDQVYQAGITDQDKVRDITGIYKRISDRDAEQGDIECYGHYLFASLLGQPAWAVIRAKAAGEPLIELALTWKAEERDLHRLNWEMMHDKQGFLLAEVPQKMVVISRVVAGWEQKAAQLNVPPKVLYVLGTTVNDPEIRPGAEFLGLLRTLKGPGISLNYRLLENATPSRIQQATEEFQPDVVHFMCHGNIDPTDNRGYLELQTDNAGAERKRKGDQLLQSLKTTMGVLVPKLVVLSACYSATPGSAVQGPYLAAPLAAELVAGGVPVVLGMGGRISDLACRLFTRGFGEAVLHRKSLVWAAGQARVIAFGNGMPPRQKADWAFPTVFMAEGVDENYIPILPGIANPRASVQNWIRNYKVEQQPMFCGREEFFQTYYDLFKTPDGPSVLVASVKGSTAKLGKTRLLEELTIRAFNDGHVPCLLRPDYIQGWQSPKDALDLAREIMITIDDARKVLGLEESALSQVSELMNLGRSFDQPSLSDSKLEQRIKRALRLRTSITPQAVRIALEIELYALVDEARRNHFIERVNGHAIILLDDVDRYGDAIDDLGAMLNPFGLGTAEEPVPVVMAFSRTDPTEVKLTPITGQNWPWLVERQLEAFSDENDEDLLAYNWILLNPFKTGETRHVMRDLPDRQTFLNYFRKTFHRMPGALADQENFYTFTKENNHLLIPADDENYITQWRQQNPSMSI